MPIHMWTRVSCDFTCTSAISGDPKTDGCGSDTSSHVRLRASSFSCCLGVSFIFSFLFLRVKARFIRAFSVKVKVFPDENPREDNPEQTGEGGEDCVVGGAHASPLPKSSFRIARLTLGCQDGTDSMRAVGVWFGAR